MTRKTDFSGYVFKLLYIFRKRFNIFWCNIIVNLVCYIKGVEVGKKARFNGFLSCRRAPFSIIKIGNNCRFNSSKHSVEVGLSKPCILLTISENSEIKIGNNCGASGVTIAAAKSVIIGDNVLIGANCTIVDTDFHGTDPNQRLSQQIHNKPVVIEDNVFLGFNCFVLKGVTIGKNSVIGANSVVMSNIPENSIAIGNPCKVIIRRSWNQKD